MESEPLPIRGAALRAMILHREFGSRAAAAHLAGWGIDERDPTIDRRIVAFCQGIPEDQYLRNGQNRWLIRRTMRGRLPDVVLKERRRGYQGADWAARIDPHERARLREEVASWSENDLLSRLLDLPRLRRLAAQWPQDGLAFEHRRVLLRSVPVARFVHWFAGYAAALDRRAISVAMASCLGDRSSDRCSGASDKSRTWCRQCRPAPQRGP